jgi:hypothetical protein
VTVLVAAEVATWRGATPMAMTVPAEAEVATRYGVTAMATTVLWTPQKCLGDVLQFIYLEENIRIRYNNLVLLIELARRR